ncbi:MAG: class I SAM-dependent methyltransferase [Vicinamibacterales bacterium]
MSIGFDAVDVSAAMLAEAATRCPDHDGRITWVHAAAEDIRPATRYGLVVAGESLHWMDWSVVFDWLPGALVDGGVLALVSGRELGGVPWRADLAALIPRFSTNTVFTPYDLVDELTTRRLFEERGRLTTTAVPFAQPIEVYVESFHTRNGFSRERMTADAASAFDAAVVAMAAPHCPDGCVHGAIAATVVWGTPRA